MSKRFISAPKPRIKSFTLLELMIVIIIIGVLAILGLSQYSLIIEGSRLAEAKAQIGVMRQLTTEYYYKNASLDGLQNSDVGVEVGCVRTAFYSYWVYDVTSTSVKLMATRCAVGGGGKSPGASKQYDLYLLYSPGTGESAWHCSWWGDSSSCFGFPP